MPRRPRFDEPGAVHHVYARGVDRRVIFYDDDDRNRYLDLVGYVARKFKWDCLSYCLMSNHVHLLIRTREANLGRGMQKLQSDYALDFNERHGRAGHLFSERYGSSRIRTSERLKRIDRYIAENPVEACLCSDVTAWRWSSRGAVAAGDAPRWLTRPRVLEALQLELDS